MKTHHLSASLRDQTKKTSQLRKMNIITGTVYGPKTDSFSVQIDKKPFLSLLKNISRNELLDLKVDDKSIKVLLHNLQKHPVTNEFLNIEFYAVDLEAKLTVEIPINLTGEAPAVKISKGILFQNLDKLKVECLPSNIIPQIVVDISILDTFDKGIFVNDLQLPETIKPVYDRQELVVKVLPPKTEEVFASTEETPTEPEVIGKEKTEEAKEETSA